MFSLLEKFINSCLEYGIAYEESNSRKTNNAHKKIEKFCEEINKRDEHGAIFVQLCSSTHEYVRLRAAVELLRKKQNIDLGVATLKELEKLPPGIGVMAATMLMVWEEGDI